MQGMSFPWMLADLEMPGVLEAGAADAIQEPGPNSPLYDPSMDVCCVVNSAIAKTSLAPHNIELSCAAEPPARSAL
jgi:hypothetical protein